MLQGKDKSLIVGGKTMELHLCLSIALSYQIALSVKIRLVQKKNHARGCCIKLAARSIGFICVLQSHEFRYCFCRCSGG